MDPPENRGHFDRLPVPLDQTADVIVLLIPDETFHLLAPTPYERVVRGTIARLDKGPVPKMIVHTPNTIVTSLQVGVPAKLFLKKFRDRDAYYIIGVVPGPEGEKP